MENTVATNLALRTFNRALSGNGRILSFRAAGGGADIIVRWDWTADHASLIASNSFPSSALLPSPDLVGPSMSEDGQRIAFAMTPSKAADPLSTWYLWDATDDLARAVGVPAASTVNQVSTDPLLSPDGNQVAHFNIGTNQVPAPTAGGRKLYFWDRRAGQATLFAQGANATAMNRAWTFFRDWRPWLDWSGNSRPENGLTSICFRRILQSPGFARPDTDALLNVYKWCRPIQLNSSSLAVNSSGSRQGKACF